MILKDNKNIVCSTSAGLSSVLMAIKLKEWYPDYNIINIMANTSKEKKESLKFMHECDKYFDLNLIWIEAIINQQAGNGTDFRVTRYDKLYRNGEIFEQGIKKYGIPCKINKWCNRELKNIPIKKYCDSIFGLNNYSIAIGLRVDEIDRISKEYRNNNLFYPLIDNGISSRDRNKFWRDQKIKLNIPAFKGNCDFCFEKSKRKLMTIYKHDNTVIDWWLDMQAKYSTVKKHGKKSYNDYIDKHGGVNFLRENMTIEQLVELSKKPFREATDEYIYENDLFDLEGDCGSACVVFD